MLPLLLILVIFFTKPVFGTGSVSIVNKTGTIVTGNPFTIGYSGSGLVPGNVYFVKAYGGVDLSTSQIYTFYNGQSLSSSTAWSNFPSITVDTGGSLSAQVEAICPNISGIATLKLRLALNSDTTKQVDAESQAITINTPTPTSIPSNTLTPTQSPTSIPNPTNTPLPSSTSTPSLTPTASTTPSITSTPTKKPSITPSPTLEPPLTPINDPLPSIDEISPTNPPSPTTSSVSPKPSTKVNSGTSYLPIIFICSGGLLLLIPLLITQLKK